MERKVYELRMEEPREEEQQVWRSGGLLDSKYAMEAF